MKVRSSQYLNNLIEQDHRRVKHRTRPMLGFKRFDNAVVTISGIELSEKIKKGQFKTGKLGGAEATMLELWNAALLPAGLSRRYPSTVAYPASTLRPYWLDCTFTRRGSSPSSFISRTARWDAA